MKKSGGIVDLVVKGILVTGLLILSVLFYQSQNSIAYVDAQKLMVGYKGTEVAKREFELKAEEWKANLDTLQKEYETTVREYQAKKSSIIGREKQLLEELLQSKQQQFLNYQQVVQDKLKQADQEISSRVLEKMNAYIKQYGERNGYTLILAATPYGNIAYASTAVDLTDEILKGLNASY